MNQKILISDSWFMFDEVVDDEQFTHLKSIAEVVSKIPRSNEEMIECIRDVDAIMLGDFQLSNAIIETGEKLKIISRVGVGYNNVDVRAATRRKIIVTNVPGALSDSVAEHTILLILAAARRLIVGDRSVREGGWNNFQQHAPDFELNGKTLGLIGFGAIGKAVSQRAKAFNMKVMVYDPYVDDNTVVQLGCRHVELDRLLKDSDVVSVHTPLTTQTERLIGERELNLMKKSAVLINTARGGVIDERSLIEALKKRKIAGAGLDVLASEPPQLENPLLELDNVILTPHSAGFTLEVMKRLWFACSDAVLRVLSGELPQPPANIVNPEVIPLLRPASDK
ncbi:MAG: hydroxyacid dehydrogenase [Candidatus Bathyarchaeia archaeon]